MQNLKNLSRKAGLTLVEVTLAIGVFTFAMSILLGLLAPMLTDLSTVLDADETQAIVNKVEFYLETYDSDNSYTDSTFEDIYTDVAATGFLQVYVYRTIGGQTMVTANSADIDDAMTDPNPDNDPDRRVFLAVLYPSSVNTTAVITGPAALAAPLNNIEAYSLNTAYASFPEGYLAFNVEVYAYAPPSPVDALAGDALAANITNSPPDESSLLLSFPTAINR